MVESVVHLQSKLHPHFAVARQVEILEHRNVPVVRARQPEQVFSGIAFAEIALASVGGSTEFAFR